VFAAAALSRAMLHEIGAVESNFKSAGALERDRQMLNLGTI